MDAVVIALGFVVSGEGLEVLLVYGFEFIVGGAWVLLFGECFRGHAGCWVSLWSLKKGLLLFLGELC